MVTAAEAAAAEVSHSSTRSVGDERSKGSQADDKKRSRRTRKRPGRKAKENKPRTKIVVRRLPPHLPEEIFKTTVDKWLGETDWWTFVAGKIATSQAKISVFSRAYLNFKNIDALLDFCRTYNGHLFVDSKGVEHRAVVEFAPFQRIPKSKKKPDPRMNTIEQDPDFLAFLKSLEEDNEAKAAASSVATGETQLEKLERTLLADQVAKEQGVAHSTVTSIVTASSSQLAGPDKPKSTPLLDALRAKKAASRAEGSKQTKAVTDAKGKESRRSEKKKSSSKSKEGGKSGSTSGMTKSVVPTGIVKRSSSPVGKKSATTPSASGASSKEATDVTPKAEQRRSRLAPTGGLFKASLGAVLGAKETKRPRGSARKQKADEDSQNDASASGDTAPEARASNGPGLQEREESKGRGYRQKRRTRLEGDLIDASADGVTAVINEGDTDTRKSKPRQVRSRDNTGTTDLSKPAEAWPEKDDSRKMSRNRVASTSSTSSMASQPPKRTGPSVTIMKRDGTTSSFNVGKNDAT